MATKKRPILIRVQPYNYEKLKAIADKNSRSISNQLEYLMIQYIEKYEKEHGTIPMMVNINNGGAGNKYEMNVNA